MNMIRSLRRRNSNFKRKTMGLMWRWTFKRGKYPHYRWEEAHLATKNLPLKKGLKKRIAAKLSLRTLVQTLKRRKSCTGC